jgi:tetratricopeptide (TPR) repeat protein
MRNADLRGSGNRPGWPRKSRAAVWVVLLLIVAGNTARGQDAPTPPPGVLADFVLSEVEFRGRANVGLAEIEEKTGLKKGARSDVFRIVESLDDIRKLYRSKGYAQVEVNLIEGSKPGETRVVIEIVERPNPADLPFPATPTLPTASAPEFNLPPILGSPLIDFLSGPPKDTFGVSAAIPAGYSPIPVNGLVSPLPPSLDASESTRDQKYNEHLERTEQARKAGEWKKALKEATAAVRLRPEDPEIHRYRSEIHASMRLYRRAISDLTEAIRLDPHEPRYYCYRGFYYCLDRDFEHGFADLEKGHELSSANEDRAKAHHWRGYAQELRGEHALAVADFDRAIELGGKSANLFSLQGQALAKMGQHDRAIADFDQAISIHPEPKRWCFRAESQLARGEFALALADYDRALEVEPNNPWYREGRARALLSLGRVDQAIDDFTQAIEDHAKTQKNSSTFGGPPAPFQTNHRAFTGRGWAYLAKHDLVRAKADFEKARAMQTPGILYFEFGFAADLPLQPRYERAIAEFNQRCSVAPNLRWALIVQKDQEARSQFLENPEFVVYFIGRSRPDPALAPNLMFRVVTDWRSFPEAQSAHLGHAIVAACHCQWQEALDDLDTAMLALVESRFPGSTRTSVFENLHEH